MNMDNLTPRLIVDLNVGKLSRWLRLMGYDTLFLPHLDDGEMVKLARTEQRILLTRDTQIMNWNIVSSGRVKVILLEGDTPRKQLLQVMQKLNLNYEFNPFSRCLECNALLETKTPKEIEGQVPPYVFKTQEKYMRCPDCNRIYWRGTHWQAMKKMLQEWQTTNST
jgi:uncharacterized protein with PIN domain